MKLKHAWVALIALTFIGCDDNSGALGLGMFPGSDQNIKGHLATFDVATQSELSGKVFAKTSIGYIGKFTDPYFGYYEAGFLAQLHCPTGDEGVKFPPVHDGTSRKGEFMVEDNIFSTEFVFSYSSYFGDSLSACRMSVYQLGVDKDGNEDGSLKDLIKKEAHFTDINPTDYYNSEALIGRKAYSAVDKSISDSIRGLSGFYPYVRVNISNTIGEKIYKASRGRKLDNDEFQKIFKGIYAKSDYGDGTVLYLDRIEMNIAYKVYARDASNDTILWTYKKKKGLNNLDSIVYSKRTFAATKEIIQSNHFSNDKDQLLKRKNETQWTFLKTPAGIYTQATLPLLSKTVNGKLIKGLPDSLKNDTINAVKLTFTTYNQTNDNNKYKFSIGTPRNVLLVREKDRQSFFEGNKIPDNITSYRAIHSASNNQYVFNNLTKLITACLAEKEEAEKKLPITINTTDEDGKPITKIAATIEQWIEITKWDKVALIPVLISEDTSQNQTTIISVQNDLQPGYAKLKGGDPNTVASDGKRGSFLKLEVISTSFKQP